MPIELFTGQPGNGKTALMVERLIAEAKKAERPLFYAGIKGLRPGLATLIKDIREWNAVKPGEVCTCDDYEGQEDENGDPVISKCTAHVVPAGSLIFVDEAWKWFGHLHDASRQATPPHALKLAEHRHRGIDFVWTSQQPNQLYPFVRGLIADHHHVVRRFGTRFIDVFSWGELVEDVKSTAKREHAQRKTRTLPSDAFGAYKSAEVHTIKAKLPLKVLAVPLLAVAAIVLGWWAYSSLRPDAFAETVTGKQTANAAPAASPSSAVPVGDGASSGPKWETRTEYAVAHLPRFGTMPWTAPVYDQRGITADPQLFCMASLSGTVADGTRREPSCTCLTEQGTRYELSGPECRTVARHGQPYNPYKQRRDESAPTGNAMAADSTVAGVM